MVDTFNLAGEPIQLEGVFCPYSIHLYDTILCIKDKCSDKFFHFYDTNSNRKIAEFGSKGKGPGEFGSVPYFIFQRQVPSEKKYLVTWDLNYVAKYISIMDIINGDFNEIGTIKIPPVPGIQRIFLFDFSNAIISSISQDGRLALYDINQSNYSWVQNHTKISNKSITNYDRCEVDNELLVISPSGKHVVGCSRYLGRINFYDNSLNIITSYQKKNIIQNIEFSGGPQGGTPITYNDIEATNNYVYILDVNTTLKDWRKVTGQVTSTVLVFTWDGSLECRLELNHSLSQFVVDENNNKIYGIEKLSKEIMFFPFFTE